MVAEFAAIRPDFARWLQSIGDRRDTNPTRDFTLMID
jgi:hypothetical protein